MLVVMSNDQLGEEEFLLLADIRRVLIGIRWALVGIGSLLFLVLLSLWR